jgi:hypothetical protein
MSGEKNPAEHEFWILDIPGRGMPEVGEAAQLDVIQVLLLV